MPKKEELLPRLPFWDRLSANEKNLLLSTTTKRSYQKGQFIHGGVEDCPGMLYLISGEMRLYLLSEEGREVTLFHRYPDELCVFSVARVIAEITFEVLICAVVDCEVLVINIETFCRLIEKNIHARCFIYELLTRRFSSITWTMQEIIFKGFDRRLASFLVTEYDRTGIPVIRMTHEQIAQRVNSAREVVARMLKRFDREGLVVVKRGELYLIEVDRLRQNRRMEV